MGHATPAALAALLPWAHRYVARLGASQNEADDVVQEALLIALRCWEVYDPRRGALRAWLTGILKNEWNALRRRSRREVPLGAEDERLARPSHEAAVEALDTLRFLASATSAERWSVIVARAEGLTGFEAARQERVSLGTAYDRVRRGRLDLAAALMREDAAAAGPMVRRRPRSKP